MRIKWTAIPNVTTRNSATPWAGKGLAERSKQEAANEREHEKKEKKKKTERAMDWLRRSR